MLLLGLLLFGLVVGGLASLVVGGGNFRQIDWTQALIAGVIGSFVGGLLISLLTGNGLSLSPAGLIGSFVGAVLVLLVWRPKRRLDR